jgi:imidazolonepropionase-like amidohydrolase
MKTALSLMLATALCTSAIGSSAWAQSGTTVIHAGTLIDTAAGTTKTSQYITVEDGLITAVSSQRRDADQGDNVTFIDLSDMTVLPGLSDSHVHLTSDASVHGYKRLERSMPRAAITGVMNAKRTLSAGFTTVRNLGAPGFTDVALKDAIEDGDVPGPRIIPAGRSIGITGGHCDSNLLPFEYEQVAGGVADGPWAVRTKVRENKKYGAQVIKFCGTGGVLSKGTSIGAQQFTSEEMEAIVDEAHALGMKVAVHAHGEKGINTAIKAGVDSVEHSSLISDEGIRLALQNGTTLSMDVYVSDYILSEGAAAGILEESLAKERQVGRVQRERFQAAVKAGVPLAFGSDAGVYPHGTNGKQFAFMVKWGQTPMQAIQSATVVNAKLFALEGKIGVIAPGAYADIIAIDDDPLDDITALEDVDFVMKNGKVISGNSVE